jgi:hypothetical protein
MFALNAATTQTAAGVGPATAASPFPTGGLSLDPMMRYLMATALYQEVHLINHYIADAATRDPGQYDPYVVRLQVSLLPLKRNESVDAYTTIALFNGKSATLPYDDFDNAVVNQKEIKREFDTSWFKAPEIPKRKVPGVNDGGFTANLTPVVIPLLVTDDLEAMAHSRSLEDLQKLSLAVSIMLHGANAGGGLDTVNDKVQTVLGKDYNSVFTVARASDNAVRVRFGAQLTANSHYAMIPQTHNVTLLILVPHLDRHQSQPLHIVADTQFVDAVSGKLLHALSNEEFNRARNAISSIWQRDYAAVGFGDKCDITDADSRLLLSYVQRNDFDSFKEFLNQNFAGANHEKTTHFAEAFWIDLVSLQNKSRYAFADIVIPASNVAIFPNAAAPYTALLVDNGKDTCVATVQGGGFLDKSLLDATLTITANPRPPAPPRSPPPVHRPRPLPSPRHRQ